jgi:hypothetical protein
LGQRRQALVDHAFRISGDLLTMKERLDQAPLLQVIVALAGQQAVAQHLPRSLKRLTLAKLAVMGHQHTLDKIGVIEHINGTRANAHIGSVAMVARQVVKESQWIALHLEQEPQGRPGAWPGGVGLWGIGILLIQRDSCYMIRELGFLTMIMVV